MDTFLITGIQTYVTGLLRVVHNGNCVRLSQSVGVSHDYLSRVLKKSDECVFALVSKLVLKTLGKFSGGVIIIDDTTISKIFARVIEGCSWLWSSNDERIVFGYQVVVLIWSNGALHIPLKWSFYKKEKDKKNQITKIDIALELLEYAKNTLQLKPEKVLFDSFYGAEKILRRIEGYGWQYVTKIKSNRTFNGKQIKKTHRHPYWEETGVLSSGLTARIIRHGRRYFLTNDFGTEKKKIILFYDARWVIEEMFRVIHSRLRLDECQSRLKVAQMNHTTLVMSAYVLLAREETRSEFSTYYTIHDLCLRDTDYATQLVEDGFTIDDLVDA